MSEKKVCPGVAASSVARSFFEITTGRSHGVIPTSDAIRIVLDSGATLVLEKACDCPESKGCGDGCARRKLVRAEAGTLGEPWARATGERVDQALSALVGELVLGEAGVEVTEWRVPAPEGTKVPHVQFGRHGVPLFTLGRDGVPAVARLPHPETGGLPEENDDEAVARLLLDCVEVARRDQNDRRIFAVVVHIEDRCEVGVACLPERPEPPVGATLLGRRTIGGSPRADVPWEQIEVSRFNLIRRAIDKLGHDCELAGHDLSRRILRLSLVDAEGREFAGGTTLPWAASEDDFDYAKLERAVGELTAAVPGAVPASDGKWIGPTRPQSLRVTAVRR